jgi:hypothetical protein
MATPFQLSSNCPFSSQPPVQHLHDLPNCLPYNPDTVGADTTVDSLMLTLSAGMCLPSRSLAEAVYYIKNLVPSNGSRSIVFRGRCLETNAVSKPFASNCCSSGSYNSSFEQIRHNILQTRTILSACLGTQDVML